MFLEMTFLKIKLFICLPALARNRLVSPNIMKLSNEKMFNKSEELHRLTLSF